MTDYRDINRQAWDVRTLQHLDSDFYDVKGWLEGKSSLCEIELALLGDLKGKSLLHLQCHFGQDTLSLARMGAQVTGLDLSPKAIGAARDLAEKAGLEARFIEGDVYQTTELVGAQFDWVFTTYGVLGWLPDMARWAKVVADSLKPGGEFLLVEFHPVVWMMDEGLEQITYPYMRSHVIANVEDTYTDTSDPQPMEMHTWNHGLAEVIQALLNEGLELNHFEEYDYSPYPIFADRNRQVAPSRFQVLGLEGKLPLCFSVRCRKTG